MELKTTVVNIRTDKYDEYIGRGSFLGNPYKIGVHGSRTDVILKYRIYFYALIKNKPEFKKKVLALKGKILACYCKPLSCHGDIVVEYLDGNNN